MSQTENLVNHYSKTLKFAEQCRTEFYLAEEYFRVATEAWKWNLRGERELAKQMIENFKLLAYREWKKSWIKVDRFGGALWRAGHE